MGGKLGKKKKAADGEDKKNVKEEDNLSSGNEQKSSQEKTTESENKPTENVDGSEGCIGAVSDEELPENDEKMKEEKSVEKLLEVTESQPSEASRGIVEGKEDEAEIKETQVINESSDVTKVPQEIEEEHAKISETAKEAKEAGTNKSIAVTQITTVETINTTTGPINEESKPGDEVKDVVSSKSEVVLEQVFLVAEKAEKDVCRESNVAQDSLAQLDGKSSDAIENDSLNKNTGTADSQEKGNVLDDIKHPCEKQIENDVVMKPAEKVEISNKELPVGDENEKKKAEVADAVKGVHDEKQIADEAQKKNDQKCNLDKKKSCKDGCGDEDEGLLESTGQEPSVDEITLTHNSKICHDQPEVKDKGSDDVKGQTDDDKGKATMDFGIDCSKEDRKISANDITTKATVAISKYENDEAMTSAVTDDVKLSTLTNEISLPISHKPVTGIFPDTSCEDPAVQKTEHEIEKTKGSSSSSSPANEEATIPMLKDENLSTPQSPIVTEQACDNKTVDVKNPDSNSPADDPTTPKLLKKEPEAEIAVSLLGTDDVPKQDIPSADEPQCGKCEENSSPPSLHNGAHLDNPSAPQEDDNCEHKMVPSAEKSLSQVSWMVEEGIPSMSENIDGPNQALAGFE